MASTIIVPIELRKNVGRTTIVRDEVRELTLKELGLTEADLEEFVRSNVDVVFPDSDETLLVVGQQVRNQEAGRADLVAVDDHGNIVLIELKRDRDDATARREPFEFQAVRYAASYARIRTQQDLVEKLFAPYIEKHRQEPEFSTDLAQGLTAAELAARRLERFLQGNRATGAFNRAQRIVLIASGFDAQTQSACAWLAKSGIDVRCVAITPVRHQDQLFFSIEQIIPPPSLDDFFVPVAEPSAAGRAAVLPRSDRQPRRVLPRMADLLAWKLIAPGDPVHVRGFEGEQARIVDEDVVEYRGERLGYNDWGQRVTGWSAINVYEWTVHEPTGKTLDVLRREKLEADAAAEDPGI